MADRPALDVTVPSGDSTSLELIDAVMDDFNPFAIEEMTPAIEMGTARQKTLRRVHFLTSDDRAAACEAIDRRFRSEGICATPVDVIDDGEAWARRSQADLRAIRVGHVTIAPPWDIPAAAGDTHTVVIEPSMGFGTGHHTTTRLCVRALQQQPVQNSAVIDFGTVSGVLGIAAAKLGARSVVAIDHDRDAVDAARRSISRNGVDRVVALRCEELRTLAPPPLAPILLANLTGALLCALAETLKAAVTPSGALILSGLTIEEDARVLAALGPSVTVRDRFREEEWCCLVVQRHP